MTPFCERPCAAPGLISYRYKSRYGWIMIGAHNNIDAMREAARSVDYLVGPEYLEIWNGEKYVPAAN